MRFLKHYIILPIIYLATVRSLYSQYGNFQVKENYDNFFNISKNTDLEYYLYTKTNAERRAFISDYYNMYMYSQLSMYELTKDKAYLVKFVIACIKIQRYRLGYNGWTDNPATKPGYYDGAILRPMAKFVYMVSNDNSLATISFPEQLLTSDDASFIAGNINTYGAFSEWLAQKIKETFDYYFNTDNKWNTEKGMFEHSPDVPNAGNPKYNPMDINRQAQWAVPLLYLGLSNVTSVSQSTLTDYRAKANTIGGLYMGKVKLFEDGLFDNSDCENKLRLDSDPDECFEVDVMRTLSSHNSYWWFSNGWGGPENFIENHLVCSPDETRRKACLHDYANWGIEDISHGMQTLLFPIVAQPIYSGLFTTAEMVKWRNTFTKRIYDPAFNGDPTKPGFQGNVLGVSNAEDINLDPPKDANGNLIDKDGDGVAGDVDDIQIHNCTPGYIGYFNCWKYRSLSYMPLYKYDDIAGETPNVYDIIMQFYDRDVSHLTNNDLSSDNMWAGEDYYGLAEVAKAQWDKECPNLTLYNRDVVYDQDFFAEGELTIAPNQTTDKYYTGLSYAEPQITTQDFFVENGVEANFSAGKRIVVKKGHIKQGARSRGYIDESLACGSGKTSRMAKGDNAGDNKGEMNNAELDKIDHKEKELATTVAINELTTENIPAATNKEKGFVGNEKKATNKFDNSIHQPPYISIVPNPTSGQLMLTLNGSSENGKTTIYNTIGDIITQIILHPNQPATVDLSIQPKGIYFLKTQYGENLKVQKIVLQ